MAFHILSKVSVMMLSHNEEESLESWTDDSFEEPATKNAKFLCQNDGKLFGRISAIQHRKIHCEDIFRCRDCPKNFDTKNQLNSHQFHCNNEEKIIPCGKCDKEFNNPRALRRHDRVNHQQEVYSCKECGDLFTRKDALQKHYSRCKHRNTAINQMEIETDIEADFPLGIRYSKANTKFCQ